MPPAERLTSCPYMTAMRSEMTREDRYESYDNPLIVRYASKEMAHLFSPRRRILTWRKVWLALAESEHELGLPVTREQVDDLRLHLDDVDWPAAEAREREVRHDVMAHVHAYGLAARKAVGIIHLGATSCDITDNADLVIFRDALRMIARKTAAAALALAAFADREKDRPTLGYTHFQPAQPTTVGKRAALWAQDFLLDLREVERCADEMPFRGIVGTTGTQASFLALFDGDQEKCLRLSELVREKMGFAEQYSVAGQTYTRKLDSRILSVLAGIGESAAKFAGDIRLLAHLKEIEEPFEKNQIGSSAMAYKRNPMRSERICSLARFLMSLPANGWFTHAGQWLERTLDDSADRRLSLPQAFLAADAILCLIHNVASGLVVYPEVIQKNLMAELPFMATENLLMAAVKAGGNRQELHERIRIHSQAAANEVKMHGRENDLIERLSSDPAFSMILGGKGAEPGKGFSWDPRSYIGRAAEQVTDFLHEKVALVRKAYPDADAGMDDPKV